MNILFVTQFFYPENFRINDLAVRLVQKGHSVTVLTGLPNYPQGTFYEGYNRKGPYKEIYEGVKIIRHPVIPRGKTQTTLVMNYLSFVVMGTMAAKKLLQEEEEKRQNNPDEKFKDGRIFDAIYVFGTSPITQALPAIYIRKKTGTPIILNVQDLWPDNVVAITGLSSKTLLWGLDRLVDYIYNRCDVILGTSHSFVKAIRERKGLKQKKKVGYYPQYSVVKPSEEPLRRDLMPEGNFHIAFTGNIGEGQGLDLLIESAALYRDEYQGEAPVVFDLFGDGRARERLEAKVRSMELSDMIRFHGRVPESDIPAILKTADASLLILNQNPIFEKTIPAKLQTYLACGCPVVACVEGEAKTLIEKNKVGICAKSQDRAALTMAIHQMAQSGEEAIAAMREKAILLSETEFDAEKLVDKMEGFMEILSKI